MTSYIVIILFASGIIIGWLLRNKQTFRKKTDLLITWSVYLLLFLLGISVGTNNEIVSNFSNIGYKALVLTIGAIAGCLPLAYVVYKYFFKSE